MSSEGGLAMGEGALGALSLEDVGASRSTLAYDSLEQAFPKVDAGMSRPFGSRVLVQIRTPMKKTKGGLILAHESQETEKWNAQVAKVIGVGPLAFRNRDTRELWPEGAWCAEGDYVRVPKYGGDRWEVAVPGTNEEALFVVFQDQDIIGPVDNPLEMIAYIK